MPRFLKPLLFALCCAPFGWLLLRAFGVAGLGLGANPIDELMDRLGDWGLRLLLLTLCVTPLAVTLRRSWLVGLRRMLGLFAFAYLSLHLLNWLVLDQWFDTGAIVEDIRKRPYITAGMTAYLLLVPLAVTSTRGWMRRLGRRWVRLHRLIYPAAALGCIHFWWQVKADIREPLAYCGLLLVLLGWRAWRARMRRVSTTRLARAPR